MQFKKLASGGLSIVLFLTVNTFCFADKPYSVIEKNHKKGLANEKGEIVIPTHYDDIGWSKGSMIVIKNIIGYKKGNKWGMLNLKNQKVSDPEFHQLYPYNDDVFIGSKTFYGSTHQKFGLVDTKGNEITGYVYDDIKVNDDKIIAGKLIGNQLEYGLLDEKGIVQLSLDYADIKIQNKFLYAVSEDMKAYHFLNEEGIPVHKNTYDSLHTLYYGYTEVFKNGRSGLIDSKGAIILPPKYKKINVTAKGKIKALTFPKWSLLDNQNDLRAVFYYDEVLPFQKGIFKANVNNAEGLVNINDDFISGIGKLKILDLSDSLIAYEETNKQGVFTTSSIPILPAKYDSVILDMPNILVKSGKNGKTGWFLADVEGKMLSNESYDQIVRLNTSIFKIKKGEYWGLMRKNGAEILTPKYDKINPVFEGRLKVDFYGDNGVLDENGEWIIMPQKEAIDLLPGNKYLVRSPYGSAVVSFDEDTVFETDYFLYPHGALFLEKNLDLKYGLVDGNGHHLTKSIYDSISSLQQDSLYYAFKGDQTSFISKSGKIMIRLDHRFEEIKPMSDDFIGIKIDGKYGYVDPNGDLRIANQYQDVDRFKQGLGSVKVIGNWGFVNKIEDFIVQPRYDTVQHFVNGVCIVVDDGKFGLVDTKGNVVIKPKFDHLERLSNNAFVSELNGKKGLIDKNGRSLILPRFHTIQDLNNGWVIVSRNNKFGLIMLNGVSVIPMMYDDMIYDQYNDLYLVKESTDWEVIEMPGN